MRNQSVYTRADGENQRSTPSAYGTPQQSRSRHSISQQSFYRGHNAGTPHHGFTSSSAKTGKRTDGRNVQSEEFRREAIKTIIRCLSWNKYPYSVTPKTLTNPSKRDFLTILGYLFQLIDPSMQIDVTTANDDIPRFYRELGYPVSIPKSSLVSPGTAHAWPCHLAALAWLCELLSYENGCFPDITKGEDTSSVRFASDMVDRADQVLRQVAIENYRSMQSGRNNGDQLDSTLLHHLEERLDSARFATQSKRQEYQKTKAECESIRKELHVSEEVETFNREKQDDVRKLKEAIEAIRTRHAELLTSKNQHLEVQKQKQEEVNKLNIEQRDLEQRIAEQGVTREEVKQMQLEIELKRKSSDNVAKELEQVKADLWNTHMQTETSGEELKTVTRKIHALIDEVCMNVQAGKFGSASTWSAIKRFNIDLSLTRDKTPDSLLGVDWKLNKKAFKQALQNDNEKRKSLEEASERLNKEVQALTEEMTNLQASIERQTEQVERSKQKYEDAARQKGQNQTEVQERIALLSSTSAEAEKIAQEKVRIATEEIEQMEAQLAVTQRKRRELIDSRTAALHTELSNYAAAVKHWKNYMSKLDRTSSNFSQAVTQEAEATIKTLSTY